MVGVKWNPDKLIGIEHWAGGHGQADGLAVASCVNMNVASSKATKDWVRKTAQPGREAIEMKY